MKINNVNNPYMQKPLENHVLEIAPIEISTLLNCVTMKYYKVLLFILFTGMVSCNFNNQKEKSEYSFPAYLFQYSDNMEPRWVSFENITGKKGQGGMENYGAKGHPCDFLRAGESKTLLDITGPGIINRIWITISDRSPRMLRSLVINMYWDGESKPAVSAPFGDFFGIGLGRTAAFQNALFSNPEGRSFNSNIQMPFKRSARIEIINESDYELPMIFYDVDLQLLKEWDESFLYFHCFWQRDTATALAQDFEILPRINGRGRFLGTNVSVNANPVYRDYWWGEGEVKVYLNGDTDYPTLVGTGTEDYIGTAWGQGQYYNQFQGCPIADAANLQWTFYRYHIPDPVYFKTDCRVTIQQIGGSEKANVLELQKKGINLIPITIHQAPVFTHIYEPGKMPDLSDPELPEGWVNFYRSDDLAAASYFYFENPVSELPEIQPLSVRLWNLIEN